MGLFDRWMWYAVIGAPPFWASAVAVKLPVSEPWSVLPPSCTVRAVGDCGGWDGTPTPASDESEVPAALVAATRKAYWRPLVRPTQSYEVCPAGITLLAPPSSSRV